MKKLHIGVAGLGRAFSLMAPTFAADERVRLVAAADPRPEALRQFASDFHGRGYASVEQLCGDAEVEILYVATPHELHAQHAILAAQHGKHLLVEKPMALTVAECRAITEAARENRVQLVVGHSHSFDLPILHTKKLVDSGAFGKLRMLTALNFTDYLYRPRRPEELDSTRGGGAVINQAAHHVDIVRLLAGASVKSVRAATGSWDPARPTEGAYSALVSFQNGVSASLSYSGYAHFDSDELCGWIGEGGQRKDPQRYGAARKLLTGDEQVLKNERNYGGARYTPPDGERLHQHFGLLIASCERADLRPLPNGVLIYGDTERRLDELPAPKVQRAGVIDELYGAVVNGRVPLHDGDWGTVTLELCLAILRSSREQKEILFTVPSGWRI